MNESAQCADLILSINATTATGRNVFNLIKKTKSIDCPDGHSGKAQEALEKKFEPKTVPSKTKLHMLFRGAKMKNDSDPVDFNHSP